MHISLTEKLEDYVKGKVQSGLYNNASEVVREALRQKIAADETDAMKLQRLRDALDPAIAEAEAGLSVPFDMQSIIAEVDQETAPNA